MKLIIAEKPSVARAISPVLGANKKNNGYTEGNGYIVSWCFGHLVGLYDPDEYGGEWAEKPWRFSYLPMLPGEWKFKISKDCEEQFGILKKLMHDRRIDEVICATDADREGECIFRYVYHLAGCRKPVKRLWVSSLEESAIKEGFAHLKDGAEYDDLYDAGFCRAKADWLVGMNASRLFSVRYNTPLNLGRVQTPTLAMIVQRDYDVQHFVKRKYFTIELDCGAFTASSEKMDDENAADLLVSKCCGKSANVKEVKKEIKNTNPPKLYDLTTLQRDANKQFGYTAKQTLDFLQSLYEKKLSTYPRTDSQYLSDDMEQTAASVVHTVFSVFSDFGSPQEINVKRCINNAKVSGHHAILPTENIAKTDLSALSEGELHILKLISARLVMAAAMPHKYEAVKITVICENTEFFASGKTVLQDGWKVIEKAVKAALRNANADAEPKEEQPLPAVAQGQIFENVSAQKAEHWTSPPKPYTEDMLLSAMETAGNKDYDENSDAEKKGLGTPATRAATIEGLVKHGLAQRKGKQITATEKGANLISVVPDEVKSPKLTADWETLLQGIAIGLYDKDDFMSGIIAFISQMCEKYGSCDKSAGFGGGQSETIGKCPKCGKEIGKGKFGFYCTGKCGMNVAKVYGKELTETQLKKLLSGKEISYTANGKKTIVLPEVVQNDWKGKTYFQWKTKKG